MDNHMFAGSQVGNPTKLFIWAQGGKTKKYRLCHSTSIIIICRIHNKIFISLNGVATHAGHYLVLYKCFAYLKRTPCATIKKMFCILLSNFLHLRVVLGFFVFFLLHLSATMCHPQTIFIIDVFL